MTNGELTLIVKEKARQLGFTLVGVTLPQRPDHMNVYMDWLSAGRYASMDYLANQQAVERRADPSLILPECRSILVLGTPYSNPKVEPLNSDTTGRGRVAAYAWGDDYHVVLPTRMQELIVFLESLIGQPVANRWYTDTGPVLERELAMCAGLGWIGKNTCLIVPGHGSYFFLSEIFLDVELVPDKPFLADQCGTCTRCLDACPTGCILSNRTLDARSCISYQTIENKAEIPKELRPMIADWVFGCDICQIVCPWNIQFAQLNGDTAFSPRPSVPSPFIADELQLTPHEFNKKFKNSPLKRTKRRGYLRNNAIAAGNSGNMNFLPALGQAENDDEPIIIEAAQWALHLLQKITPNGSNGT